MTNHRSARARHLGLLVAVVCGSFAVVSVGCSSTNTTGSSDSNVTEGAADTDVCKDMSAAATKAKSEESILDLESEYDLAKERERDVLIEVIARAEACAKDGISTSSCEGLSVATKTTMQARLKKLATCTAPQTTPDATAETPLPAAPTQTPTPDGTNTDSDASSPDPTDPTSTDPPASDAPDAASPTPTPPTDAGPTGLGASKTCKKVSGTEQDAIWVNAACEVSRASLKKTFESNASKLCDYLAKIGTKKPSLACATPAITGICGLIIQNASTGASNAEQGTEVLNQSMGVSAGKTLSVTFTTAAIACLKAAGKEAITEVVEEGAKDAAKLTFKTALTKAGAVGLMVGLAACKVAGDQVADAISTARQVDYDNACSASAFSFTAKHRVAACMKTGASLCAAYAGSVNFEQLAGLDPNSVGGFFAGVAGAGVSATCAAGGTLTNVLCGTINQAGLQIRQAITTGNNDWATCIPTAQAGACIGTLYANWQSGGWTNNSGVETAQGTGDDESRSCCWCYKDSYKNDGYLSDTRVSRENWLGVIQAGDYKSGNCPSMEKKGRQTGGIQQYSDDGYELYYRYSECGKAKVKGSRCSPDDSGTVYLYSEAKKDYIPTHFGP